MKQLGLAILQYAQDYDEVMPMAWAGATADADENNDNTVDDRAPSGCYSWRWAISPYVKSTQVFFCPSAPTLNTWTPTFGTEGECRGTAGYGANQVYAQRSTAGTIVLVPSFSAPWEPINIASIYSPPETVLIADWIGRRDITGQNDAGQFSISNFALFWWESVAAAPAALRRHADGANYLWCDGHVQWKVPNEMMENYAGRYGRDLSPWTIW